MGEEMNQVINNLKNKEIIYKKSVEVLKKYIESKYPEANELFRARVFADAVHKIIDEHVREFNRDHQLKIKKKLIENTAAKASFEIVAYDIMKTCVALEIDEDTFIDNMTSWINRQQSIPVYRDTLIEMTGIVRVEMSQEAFMEEMNQSAGLQSSQVNDDLMAQLEAGLDYEPVVTYGSDAYTPELYTEGVKNEAYEAEMRKDLAEEVERRTEGDLESGFDDTSLAERTQALVSRENTLGFFYEDYFEDEDDGAAEPMETSAIDHRPIRKITMDPEPYFSETPSIWDETPKKRALVDKLMDYLEGRNLRRLAIMAVAGVLMVVMLVWILVFITQRPIDSLETTPMDQTQGEVISQSFDKGKAASEKETMTKTSNPSSTSMTMVLTETLPESLQYKPIDQSALKLWFVRNGSLIGETPHFETILEVAEDYGVNPLLLFAITGQEQGFVPKDHEFALEMINNPFNVYGSWESYNTNLKESAQIAARTVLTASEQRPEDMDPVVWINGTYAEDGNWSQGVNMILDQLEIVAGR